jgi:hypothetical protein
VQWKKNKRKWESALMKHWKASKISFQYKSDKCTNRFYHDDRLEQDAVRFFFNVNFNQIIYAHKKLKPIRGQWIDSWEENAKICAVKKTNKKEYGNSPCNNSKRKWESAVMKHWKASKISFQYKSDKCTNRFYHDDRLEQDVVRFFFNVNFNQIIYAHKKLKPIRGQWIDNWEENVKEQHLGFQRGPPP